MFGCIIGCAFTEILAETQLVLYAHRFSASKIAADLNRFLTEIIRWRLQLLEFALVVVHLVGIKHRAPEATSNTKHPTQQKKLRTERTDRTRLYEELPVLMIDKIKEKRDVQTKYFDEDRSGNGQDGNPLDRNGEEPLPPTLREPLEAQEIKGAWNQTALTIGILKPMFTLDTEFPLVRNSKINGASQWYVLATLRTRILHKCRKSILAGHPGDPWLYEIIQQHFHWSPNSQCCLIQCQVHLLHTESSV